MRIKQRQYPYPVLSFFSDDLPRCTFQTAIQQKCVTKTAFEMDAQCKTSNPELRNLVKEHKACYALHLECTSTNIETWFRLSKRHFLLTLMRMKLTGELKCVRLFLRMRIYRVIATNLSIAIMAIPHLRSKKAKCWLLRESKQSTLKKK